MALISDIFDLLSKINILNLDNMNEVNKLTPITVPKVIGLTPSELKNIQKDICWGEKKAIVEKYMANFINIKHQISH